jgi:hypothetical protein
LPDTRRTILHNSNPMAKLRKSKEENPERFVLDDSSVVLTDEQLQQRSQQAESRLSRSAAKSQIEKLVLYFQQNIHQLKSPTFNEAQTRQYLIDPFFEALGWDVRNSLMLPPYKLEVIPEGRVKTSLQKPVSQKSPSVTADDAADIQYITDDEYKADQRAATKKPDYRFHLPDQTLRLLRPRSRFDPHRLRRVPRLRLHTTPLLRQTENRRHQGIRSYLQRLRR